MGQDKSHNVTWHAVKVGFIVERGILERERARAQILHPIMTPREACWICNILEEGP